MLTVNRRHSIHKQFQATRDRQICRAWRVERHDKTGRQHRSARWVLAITGLRKPTCTGRMIKKCSLAVIGKVSAPASRIQEYINPDDIAKYISLPHILTGTAETLGVAAPHYDKAEQFDAFFAARLAQQIAIGLRSEWVDAQLSLTYESVMSHESHLDFVDYANKAGFESYLYYICTSDSLINQQRVKNRVMAGGHDVPQDKIVSRYNKSLELLYSMAKKCKRAYFFDNSAQEHTHFAEITPDGFLDIYESEFNRIDASWFISSLLEKWPRNKVRLASL